MQNKQKKNRIIIIASAILLGVVLFLLMLYDFNTAIRKNVTAYNENQNLLADIFMKNAVIQSQKDSSDIEDNIILDIKDKFPTSSSVYCILAKNDEIIYLKDDNTTSTLMNETLANYFNNNISKRDNMKYLISKSEAQYKGAKYALIICTKQNYYIKKIKLYEIRLHLLGYFVLYAVILLIIVIFTFYKLRSEENNLRTLDLEVKNNRRIIDKLENDKNKNYVNSEKESDYSFYNRSIVNEVMNCMTEEEKEQCIQIDIIVENLKMEHFVLITAILGRIKQGNSIACYWEDNQFKVLLFHSNKDEVQEFINLFISKYKLESEEKVEELKIVAQRYLAVSKGGTNEI